jgi:hypothetical protein
MEPNKCGTAWLVALGSCLCLGPAAGCSSSADSCGSSESKCGTECQVSSTTPVAWTDQTALGSPEAAFSAFAGTCQAPFSWSGTAWGQELVVEPVQGNTTVTATVVLDPSSARFVTRTPMCPDQLAVEGVVTLELPEGNVADQQPVTLTAPGVMATGLAFSVQEEDFGPWVSIRKSDPASSLTMSISMAALAQGCSGQIVLNSMHVSDGMGFGGGGTFAVWSDRTPAVRSDDRR